MFFITRNQCMPDNKKYLGYDFYCDSFCMEVGKSTSNWISIPQIMLNFW